MRAPLRRIASVILLALTLGSPAIAAAEAITAQDVQIYREAFKAAERGNLVEARRLANRARTELPAKVILWMELSGNTASAGWEELRDFIRGNPDWPNQIALRRNAERAMPAGLPPKEVVAWFEQYAPVSTIGFTRQVDALMELRRSDDAIALVRRHYVNGSLGAVEERDFRKRFNSLLRPSDHWARIDRLLWDGDAAGAKRNLSLVDKGRQHVALARIALMNMEGGVDGALRRVPSNLLDDPGLVYERVRWRRKKDLTDGALELLAKAPKNLGRPEAWWTERNILARRLIEKGKWAKAYELASAPGAESGIAFAQAEFLAGWLSLRFLNKPDRALAHFEKLYRGVSSPISRSRGAYWAGRAAEAAGDAQRTRTWYETAASYPSTFYGQLAGEKAGRTPGEGVADITLEKAVITSYSQSELVRLVRLLHRIEGREGRLFELFMRRLMSNAKTAEQYQPLAKLAVELDRRDLAVFTARQAAQDGVLILEDGYPVLEKRLPAGSPEVALVHALIRQESSFDTEAVSSASARGLMQIMPATGQHIARQSGIKHSAEKLTADPDHNVRLGTIYLQGLLDRFGGSYVLAIASYNAGQGRVASWLKEIGDPRSQSTDVIDWIELMPYYETRNYVQRVMENLQVYRVRLDQKRVPISQDLNRGSGGNG